jgi:hypothetical protein
MRDLTDTMYNPKSAPYVGHFEGARLIIEHIERYVCPSITSSQIIGGKEFRFMLLPSRSVLEVVRRILLVSDMWRQDVAQPRPEPTRNVDSRSGA